MDNTCLEGENQSTEPLLQDEIIIERMHNLAGISQICVCRVLDLSVISPAAVASVLGISKADIGCGRRNEGHLVV